MNHNPRERLALARAARADHVAAFERINAAMRAIDAGTAPAREAVAHVDALKTERRSLLARLLRLGPVAGDEPEVAALSKQIARAAPVADGGQAALDAARAELADLQRQADELHPLTASLQRAVVQAEVDAAAEDVGREVERVRAAFAVFGETYARLLGAGVAHHRLVERARALGASGQALGSAFPATTIALHPLGFNIADGGQFNTLSLDLREQIDAAAADAGRRWSE